MDKSNSLPRLRIGDLEPRLPIVQGGMAVRISMAPLAAAVANAGGIGVIGASGMKPLELLEEIGKARELTDGIIGVNIMEALDDLEELVKTAINSGMVNFITAGAGFKRGVFKWCKEAKMPFVPVVSSLKAAMLSQRFGATAIAVEGKEAGGHLGTDRPLLDILKEIVPNMEIPVIGAGGIIHGRDMKPVFDTGATGVQVGTRFALSEECSADRVWKEIMINAKKEDIIIIQSPVGMPFRAVKTPFTINYEERIQRGENPKLSQKFQDEHCRGCLKDCKAYYCIVKRLELAQQGKKNTGLFTIGERVVEINDILPVKTIVKNLIDDYFACA